MEWTSDRRRGLGAGGGVQEPTPSLVLALKSDHLPSRGPDVGFGAIEGGQPAVLRIEEVPDCALSSPSP